MIDPSEAGWTSGAIEMTLLKLASAMGLAASMSACTWMVGTSRSGPDGMPAPGNPMAAAIMERMQLEMADRAKLKRFDADKDGAVTKIELEQGVTALLARFDANKDAMLSHNEMRDANAALAREDETMPPLRDWDQSGAVVYEEFAAWNLGRFRKADRDADGIVTAEEFTLPPRMPKGPPGGMPPGGMPPGGKPPGGKPPGGGMPGGGGGGGMPRGI